MFFSDTRKSGPLVEKAALFVLGFAVMATLQALGGWWLNSGTGVLRTVVVLIALGVFAALWRSGSPWGSTCALWTGSLSGTTAVLFFVGPGTIWPIVLSFAAAITGASVFVGALIGLVATRFRH